MAEGGPAELGAERAEVVAEGQQSLDPLVVDPQHYHLEFENEFVKVIRCRIPPHDKVARHHHPVGAVIIFMTDQNLRQTLLNGTKQEAHHKAGEVLWAEPSTHMGENYTDQPYEYIRVDIKAATHPSAGPTRLHTQSDPVSRSSGAVRTTRA